MYSALLTSVVGYDTSVIGGTMALDSFKRDFGLSDVSSHARDTLQGNIVSTFQAGTFFGALLTFPLGERWGRKKALMIAVCIFLAGGALMVSRSTQPVFSEQVAPPVLMESADCR